MKKQSVASIKRHRTKRIASVGARAYYLHRKGKDDQVFNLVCDEFVSLGGVYIKFLQGVLLKSEIMKRWTNPERLKIFENLDSEPLNVVSLLRSELKPAQLKQISLLQPEPFAAGSFGQVYYGQHVNGKPIIVKVLRPMVRELLKYDLKLLSAFSRQFVKYYRNVDLKTDDAIKEFAEVTLRETDYVAEANFATEMYKIYHKHPHLVIPKTYMELCTPHVIVQEYVPGISLAQLVKLHDQGIDPKRYVFEHLGSDLDAQLITLGFESLNGIFNLARIQGDPHPGNVRLLPNDQVGIIDFGIHAEAPKEKAALFGILEAYDSLHKGDQGMSVMFEQGLRFFVSDLYRALKKLGSLFDSEGEKNFSKAVGKVAQAQFEQATGSSNLNVLGSDFGKIVGVMNRIVNKGNRFGFIIKLEAGQILRAMQTYTGVVDNLGRHNAVIPKVLDLVVKQIRQDHPEITSGAEDNISVSDALETVMNWLERVAERDPGLFAQLMDRIKLNDRSSAKAANKPVKEKEVIHA